MRIERFEDIEAWQLARELTRKVYGLTREAKFARDFGLTRQIQDASGSAMHNIAEGFRDKPRVCSFSSVCKTIQSGPLTGFRSETAEMVLRARLASEDPAVVSSGIHRGG